MSLRYRAITSGAAGAKSLQVDGLLVSALDYAPETRTPAHENEGACLTVTLHGSWLVHDCAKAFACTPGVVHVVPGGARHYSRFESAGARMFALYVAEEKQDELGAARGALDSVRHFRDGRVEELARSAMREIQFPDAATSLALEGLALEMLAWTARPHGNVPGEKRSRWLRRVEERLRAEFRTTPSYEEIAREVGVHRVHLARSFRAATGLSMGAFVRRLRLEWTADQLVRTSKPLVELAAEAGFADQSHFTRLFRAKTGMTPALYRQRFAARAVSASRSFSD
jgi:AraC family transcriptional regulator